MMGEKACLVAWAVVVLIHTAEWVVQVFNAVEIMVVLDLANLVALTVLTILELARAAGAASETLNPEVSTPLVGHGQLQMHQAGLAVPVLTALVGLEIQAQDVLAALESLTQGVSAATTLVILAILVPIALAHEVPVSPQKAISERLMVDLGTCQDVLPALGSLAQGVQEAMTLVVLAVLHPDARCHAAPVSPEKVVLERMTMRTTTGHEEHSNLILV